MNIDLLPFTAFALQSCAAPEQRQAAAQTLTLGLVATSADACHEPMSGQVSANQSLAPAPEVLRVAVRPAEASAITITFF